MSNWKCKLNEFIKRIEIKVKEEERKRDDWPEDRRRNGLYRGVRLAAQVHTSLSLSIRCIYCICICAACCNAPLYFCTALAPCFPLLRQILLVNCKYKYRIYRLALYFGIPTHGTRMRFKNITVISFIILN